MLAAAVEAAEALRIPVAAAIGISGGTAEQDRQIAEAAAGVI